MTLSQSFSDRMAWRDNLDPAHWRVLTASLFGRLFDGYETFILFVVLSPALRLLLNAEQAPRPSGSGCGE